MKRLLKILCNGIALLLVSPAVLLYQASRLVLGSCRAFPGWSQALSLLPGLSGVYLRRAFYRFVMQRFSADASIGFGSVFSHASAIIGRNVDIGVFCCLGDVTLEDDVLVASHVSIANGAAQHGIERLDVPIREQAGTWPRITIGRDSWIGERAIILANVGKHCVIGAGSVVTRPIPDFAVAVGVPARVIRFREANGSAESPGETEIEALTTASSR